jgi:hypothetical protein
VGVDVSVRERSRAVNWSRTGALGKKSGGATREGVGGERNDDFVNFSAEGVALTTRARAASGLRVSRDGA